MELLKRRRARSRLLSFCGYTKEDFQAPWHIRELARELEAIEQGDIKRLMVIMPPRHGKSELVSLRFPCWYLAKHPTDRIVQAGYAESIALVHSRQARDIFIDPKQAILFPDIHHRPERAGQEAVRPERQAAHEWGAIQGGSYYAVGIGGGLTGRGFNVGIIDDPVKDEEEAQSETIREKVWDWYQTVFRTRAEPGAAIILVMTRWHPLDLAGRLLAQSREDPSADQWHVLHFPAISEDEDGFKSALWPKRYGLDELENLRSSIGGRAFESLYQGNPTIAAGQIIKREWWRYLRTPPEPILKVQSWDTAFKDKDYNDFSVCTTWYVHPTGYYLADLWRGKVEFPELKRISLALYAKEVPDVVLVEDEASGQSLIQELQRDSRVPILAIKVDRNKVGRVNASSPLIEAGKVSLPEYAPWLFDFLEECSAFPNAPHDDQVDSMTQALSYMRTPQDEERIILFDSLRGADVNMDLEL